MSSERNILRKIKKYEKRLQKYKERQREESRSRSPLRLDDSSDTPPINIEDEGDIENTDPVALFREALGEEYEEKTSFDSPLQTDITKRWNHILTHGLSQEEKDSILKKYKIPENCLNLEAPVINVEVNAVLTESSKQKDKLLESNQHQLGVATSIVGQIMTNLIKNEDIDKVKTVAKLTDASKLLNDLHYHNTKTRRILISPLLDKNFLTLIEKQNRDKYLFGTSLAEIIKNSQELKKNTQHIKKPLPRPTSTKTIANNIKTQGNRYGPPRKPTKPMTPRGGPKTRPFQPPPNRQRPAPRPQRPAPRGAHSRR
ncbi:hypothetical protein K1T71_014840 [Dendrolimus kikuchii]|nr:hypothetical protein K1T71_014840 [Dendrolimus kikuchii]